MGHLLEHEEWPEDGRPLAVAYLCGPLADETARQPGEAAAAVRRHTAEFLERRGGDIWPQAVDAGWGRQAAPPRLRRAASDEPGRR
jgi:hypothetical protein